MRREQKQLITEEIAARLQDSGTIYLTDFTGLDVQAMTEFRARLANEGVGYQVVKNTLALRALDAVEELPDISEHFQGPTGVVYGGKDPIVPAKILKEFAAEHDDRPTLKVGVVDRRVVEPEEIRSMAELPAREELLGAIAGSLTASVGGIASIFNRLLADIADMAEQAARKREEEAA